MSMSQIIPSEKPLERLLNSAPPLVVFLQSVYSAIIAFIRGATSAAFLTTSGRRATTKSPRRQWTARNFLSCSANVLETNSWARSQSEVLKMMRSRTGQ